MKKYLCLYFLFLCLCVPAVAQTTDFTYQGRLVDGSLAASGTYEMRFRLFDAENGGTQQPQPTPITLDFTLANGNAVTVTNGIFTVKLDFTASAFPGAARFLEISVRRTATDPFTLLNPRQPITSAPHNIRSLTSGSSDGLSVACVLCVTDAQIQSLDGSKVTGTVSNATTALNISGIVPIANGGTGSSTQNFVDLLTNQINIAGNKRFVQTTTLDIANVGTLTNSGGATFNGTATFNGANPVQMNALDVGNGLTADVVSVSELNALGQVSAAQFSGNGSGLTSLNATNVTTGTLADARLSTNVATLSGPQIFAGLKHFAGGLSGDASGLTNLNGSNITSGTISENRLGVAGMAFSGRISGLTIGGVSSITQYGGAIGFTDANAPENTITILSPNRTCTSMNLSGLLVNSSGVPTPPGVDNIRIIALRINQGNNFVNCGISASATSCNSGSNITVINAGSTLSMRVTTLDNGTPNDVGGTAILFGWECR